MEDYIIGVILIAIIGGIIYYLYRSKKRGQKCIGCPYCEQCGKLKSKKEENTHCSR